MYGDGRDLFVTVFFYIMGGLFAVQGIRFKSAELTIEGIVFAILATLELFGWYKKKKKDLKKQKVTEPEYMGDLQNKNIAASNKTETKKKKVLSKTEYNFNCLMTSQLAAKWLNTKIEAYKSEYLRRMRICGLNQELAIKMFKFETDILTKNPRPEMKKADFIRMPLFSLTKPFLDHPVSYYETHYEYPLSYIVKLSDEAEWHFWNSHEKNLSNSVWTEIFALSDKNKKMFTPFALHLVNQMGWSVQNVNRFSFNEQGMLDRYRWGKKISAAARDPWQMDSMNRTGSTAVSG